MNNSVIVSDFKYYKVIFNGNMYEIVNKVFENTETYIDNLPQAIGQAKAYSNIIENYKEEGCIIFEGF